MKILANNILIPEIPNVNIQHNIKASEESSAEVSNMNPLEESDFIRLRKHDFQQTLEIEDECKTET